MTPPRATPSIPWWTRTGVLLLVALWAVCRSPAVRAEQDSGLTQAESRASDPVEEAGSQATPESADPSSTPPPGLAPPLPDENVPGTHEPGPQEPGPAAPSPQPDTGEAVPSPPAPPADAPPARKTGEAPGAGSDRPPNETARFLPRPPRHDPRRTLLYALAALFALAVARLSERPVPRLASHGLLPGAFHMLAIAARILALVLAFMAILHLVPTAWTPAVPYVLIGAAVAAGWTFRDFVRDAFYGLLFMLEDDLRPGQRITVGSHAGRLVRITLRHTDLQNDEGNRVSLPNHTLAEAVVEIDPAPYHPICVPVRVASRDRSVDIRETLYELVLLIPHLAPDSQPRICRDPEHPDRWSVRARIVDARYGDAFVGALVDLVEETFGAAAGPDTNRPKFPGSS